jgi:L-threonylcarbamoyladenylate synthase
VAGQFSNWHLRRASEIIRSGGVIAYPTEAVYGLGCDPWDQYAVSRILAIKNRSIRKGLIVIASDISQLESLIIFPDSKTEKKVNKTWPGPVTWILPASDQCPFWLKGEHAGLAVRVTAHPLCRALCESAGPIVSTSANISDKPPATSGWKVQMMLGDQLDYILRGGPSGQERPSSIIDAISGKKIRS